MKKNSFSAIWLLVFGCILIMASLLMIFFCAIPQQAGARRF